MAYDPGDLYIDPILTELSVGFKDANIYGLRLAPETPVNTQSARYRVYDRSHWLIYRSRREPGTQANRIPGRKWSEDQFKTAEHSLASEIYDEERQELLSQGGLADPVFGGDLQIDPEADATEDVTRSIMLEHELLVTSTFRNTANYPSGHTATLTSGGTGTRWSNYALATAGDASSAYSNPVADLKLAFQRVFMHTGRWPNTLAFPWDAVGIIENHPRLVARFQYTGVTDNNAWKSLLGLPPEATNNLNIFIVDSVYNAADSIDAPENIQKFWGTDVWIGLVDQTPGQKTMTFAKTFAQKYPAGTTRPTDRYRDEDRKVDIVRTSFKYDVKIISGVAGYIIKTAVDAIS
jgi:hypothetical protein